MLLKLSWKNLWRNKNRSTVILLAIALGMFGGVYAIAFITGLTQQRLNNAINAETANIQIHSSTYLLNKEVTDTICNSNQLFTSLTLCNNIIAFSPRVRIIGMAATANNNAGVNIYGININAEKQVTNLYRYIDDTCGTYLNKSNTIVIGQKLAKKIKAKLRSKIIITFQSAEGDLVSAAFKVSGIFKTNNTAFDEKNVFVHLAELQTLTGFNNYRYHEIAIKVNNDQISETIKNTLQHKNKQVKIETWRQLQPDLAMMFDSKSYLLYVIIIIILLALCFGIINTMLMAVLERVREIGMLMVIGMNKAKVFKMIMIETIMLICTGAIVGLAAAFFLIKYHAVHGVNLSTFASGLESAGFASMVYPSINVKSYITVLILIIVTGVAASVIPALYALKLKPVEAISKK